MRATSTASCATSAAQTEGEHIARRLFALRLEVRNTTLASLVAARNAVCTGESIVADCVDRALATKSTLERTFWLDSLADVIRSATRRSTGLSTPKLHEGSKRPSPSRLASATTRSACSPTESSRSRSRTSAPTTTAAPSPPGSPVAHPSGSSGVRQPERSGN